MPFCLISCLEVHFTTSKVKHCVLLQDLTKNRKFSLFSCLLFGVQLLIFLKVSFKTERVVSSTPSVRWLDWLSTCCKYDSFGEHRPCCSRVVQCMHAPPACCQDGSGQHTHKRVTDFLPVDQFLKLTLWYSCLHILWERIGC